MSDEEKPAAAAAILESVDPELVQFCHSNDVQYAGS